MLGHAQCGYLRGRRSINRDYDWSLRPAATGTGGCVNSRKRIGGKMEGKKRRFTLYRPTALCKASLVSD